MTEHKIRIGSGLAAGLLLALAGCSESAPDMTTPPPPVGVMVMAPAPLREATELNGRVAALRTAEIRPQVSGVVQRRLFEQGSEVRAGEPLFQINPATFKADADSAAAALRRAEAALVRASTQAERLKPLVETEAISRQAYDDARAQRDQAAAEVTQARAELTRRQLDLKFATIEAPISGRIDQAQITEGALVSPSDATPLARIQQIDQVYVDVRQPAASLDRLQRAVDTARREGKEVKVDILRSNGEPFQLTGKLLFSGISVDEGTGEVLVRVLVDNRARRLLPGMFVKARIALADMPQALSIPQQAVARSGAQTRAWVLDGQNKAHAVSVELGELIDRRYVIRTGLKGGDKVVVEGLDRMTEGVKVRPREWMQPAQGRN